MTQYLGLDLGEKRIGMAAGSRDSRLAHALGTIIHRSRKTDLEQIQKVIQDNQISHIVIGISNQEDGTPNSMGRHALSFGHDLQNVCSLPIEYWDESLSTVDAQANALTMGYSMKHRRGHQDALAAVVILQSFLDHQKSE
jgi:putative Holliday junction resolvase